MKVSNIENLGFYDKSVVTFDIDYVPDTVEEWTKTAGQLPFGEILGEAGARLNLSPTPDEEAVGYTMSRSKDGKESRDWWAADHIWHLDGSRWDIQPTLTAIACRYADPDSPDTEILDTAKLYEQTIEDGFWQAHQLVEPLALGSVFADSTYYSEALPYMRALASEEDKAKIDERAGTNLEEVAAEVSTQHPEKKFPLVRFTPVTHTKALFVDGGVRNSTIRDAFGEDLEFVLHDLRQNYLAGNKPHDLGLVERVSWSAGRCAIFPQIGSLHRAMPGNDHDRNLALAFLTSQKGN